MDDKIHGGNMGMQNQDVNECGLHKTKRTQVSASVAFVFDMPVI
jgi:hypothetical protein